MDFPQTSQILDMLLPALYRHFLRDYIIAKRKCCVNRMTDLLTIYKNKVSIRSSACAEIFTEEVLQ